MKQEKLKQLFMLCLFGMISIGARAQDIPNDEIWYTSSDGEVVWPNSSYAFGASIVSNTYTNGKGIIRFDGNVTSIGDRAFDGCSGLTSVTIGNSVTSIGYDAFSYCSGLTSVTIPNSVIKIGDGAFYDCSGLISVTIPNSVTSIGRYAFMGCSGLTSVTIPNSVTDIGNDAFNGCFSLTSIVIPSSVTSIEYGTFYDCKGLTSVTIPNSVTSIGYDAFRNCTGLTSLTIGNSVTEIGESAFEYCYRLTNVTIPNSVMSIGDRAFSDCEGLTSVTIPNSVISVGNDAFSGCSSLPVVDNIRYADTYLVGAVDKTLTTYNIKVGTKWIGSSAFSGCSGLTSVEIPNSVTSIGKFAFSGCSGLTSLTIPNSVTSIGESAFDGCLGLTSIVVESGNKVYDSRDNCNAIMETASNILIRGCNNTTIPNSVTSIGEFAFDGCSGLTSVEIPNSVTSIGDWAFWNCSGLTSVTVHWKRPLSIDPGVWGGVDKRKCTLYVPEGTWAMYCSAPGWMDFVNIEEFSEEPGEEIYLTVVGVHGAILQQAVEIGKTYKYLLDNKKNGKIVSVTFNGKDVTADVTDGKYKTPKITGNSEIYVEYDNQPLGDVNLDGKVNVNDITKTAEIILLRAKEEMEAD